MKIGVVFGSRSPEHDVSITSAYGVMQGLKKHTTHEIIPLYITRTGQWIYEPKFEDINNFQNLESYKDRRLHIDFSHTGKLSFTQSQKGLFGYSKQISCDLVFVLCHGLNGEDGSLQGLFQLLDVAYVSADLLGSSIGMNKTLMKNIFTAHNIPIPQYLTFSKKTLTSNDTKKIETTLKYPLFVKPANLGSSIGVSRVSTFDDLSDAFQVASYYDHEVIVEEAVENLIELNCSVIEKEGKIKTTLVEQPLSSTEFLSFEEKYIQDGGSMQGVKSKVKIPADIPEHVTKEVHRLTKKVYEVLKINGGCPRVDFLYDKKQDQIYVNEINTIPGAFQMHLWKKSGYDLQTFFEDLIHTALEKRRNRKLNIDFQSNIIDHTRIFTK